MRKDAELEEARNTIALSGRNFVSPIIEKAAKYLRDNRNDEGAWGHFKGLHLDLHVSALSIEALRVCNCSEFESSAEDAASHIKTIIIDKIESYDVQQLVDSLNILTGTKPKDSELEKRVVARLNELQKNTGWGEMELSIGLSCRVILALMKLEDPSNEIIKQWVDYLVQCQHSEDGG